MASLMVGTLGKSWVRVIVYYGVLESAPNRHNGDGLMIYFHQVMWEWWVNVDTLAVIDATIAGDPR